MARTTKTPPTKTAPAKAAPAKVAPPKAAPAKAEALVVFTGPVNEEALDAAGLPAAGVTVADHGHASKLVKAVVAHPDAKFICAFVPSAAKMPEGWLKTLCVDDGRAHAPAAAAFRGVADEPCALRQKGSWIAITIPRRLFDTTNVLAAGDSTLCLDDALAREGVAKAVHGDVVVRP